MPNGNGPYYIMIKVSKQLKDDYENIVKSVRSDFQKFTSEIIEILVTDREAFVYMNQKRLSSQLERTEDLFEDNPDQKKLELIEN